jgi:hypothetical protein
MQTLRTRKILQFQTMPPKRKKAMEVASTEGAGQVDVVVRSVILPDEFIDGLFPYCEVGIQFLCVPLQFLGPGTQGGVENILSHTALAL